MPSLRRHLLLGAAAAITGVFAVLAGILYLSVRTWLIAGFDRALLAQAESLKAATEFHHGSVRIDFDGPQPASFLAGPHPEYFELWLNGRPVDRSNSLGGRDLPLPALHPNSTQYHFNTLPGGSDGREIATAFELHPELEDRDEHSHPQPLHAPLILVVAQDTLELTSELAFLRWLLAATCGAALLIGLALLAWIIRRGMRPVDAIAARIEAVGRASLSDRLEARGVPRELLPIIDRLNDMLARLESAFTRERAFTADVAHELRTPLAGLETSLEVCSSRVRKPQEYQKVLGRCLGVVRQMHAMVDSLLTLARADAGTLAVARKSFSLDELLDESWAAFAGRAGQRNLRITRIGNLDGLIDSDREKLRQVLHNVFDNAVSYADEGGTIAIELIELPESVSLEVANSGSRLSNDQAQHAFERFWRGDAARSNTGAHCGLGLAISRELLQVVGGSIEVSSADGGEFRVHILLPRSDQPMQPARRSETNSPIAQMPQI